MLSSESTKDHPHTNLKSDRIISIEQLYNSDCSTLFTKRDVTIFNPDNNTVLNRKNDISDGLWNVTITLSQPESSPTAPTNSNTNHILFLDKTKSELDIYLHAASVCPTKTTFFQKIHNWGFITCPGLTSKLISWHLPLYLPILKGHLKQEQQKSSQPKHFQQKRNLKHNHFLNINIRHKTVFYDLNKVIWNKLFWYHWNISDYF